MVGADASQVFGASLVQAAPVSAAVVASVNTVATAAMPVGNTGHLLAGRGVPNSGETSLSWNATEGVPYSRETPTVGPAQAHDAVLQSLGGQPNAQDKEAAALWDLAGWSSGPSERKQNSTGSAVDAVMAMLEKM